MANNRAVTVDEIENKKYKDLVLEGDWLKLLGEPESSGSWIVWGQSGSGKSRFTMMLAKCLAGHGKVLWNDLEEGVRKSMQKTIRECKMIDVKQNFLLLNKEPIEDLKVRLRKRKSAKFIFINSVQHSKLTKVQFIDLINEFPNKLFIFISHAEGKEPKGTVADFVRYDSDIKIRVEGYKAFPISRLGGGEPYVIWPEEAAKYWLDLE
ncbi:hypothetical protein FNO01nite_30170 [Flavobacterium noncentrifugens]|uniref:AAA+ ATPase domain-containing protein n=1 Tax=Flavobacterium noncentrifugens TaxID=1128970 RepID=A0A1G9BS87_9FLAO|nr:hypothetical protein [Flavobacterium noncentrifugens]GEP52345.1 hypothetical protein FNO01nite_30170 [Flavobacterium noncentrifugens]SDK42170.1 hypothetical protein SAMN04487935_3329 [Flavobacterium noncentrifugens]